MRAATIWIGSLGGLAAGLCAGFLVGSTQSPTRPADAAVRESERGEMPRVLVELSALRAELRTLREEVSISAPPDQAPEVAHANPPQAPVVAESGRREVQPPASPELQELLLHVDALQAAVEELTRALSELTEGDWTPSAVPTIAQIRAGKSYTDWAAVRAVRQAYDAAATKEDKKAVVEALMYMTHDEALSRFGRPTRIVPRWLFYGHELGLNFLNGYVVSTNLGL